MNRKIFISFLGSSNYGSCMYRSGNYTSNPVRYIQEATLEYLNQQEGWKEDDRALILMTDGAFGSRRKNWEDNGHNDRDTGNVLIQQGLCSTLSGRKLKMQIHDLTVPAGNTTEELWEIFQRIFSQIEEGDQLHIDITHGFRYLPMLTLVLSNYTRFLKKTTVKSLSYGNYEGRIGDVAPIVDLMPFVLLQDWTHAAGSFMRYGRTSQIIELLQNERKLMPPKEAGAMGNLTKSLRDMENIFYTARAREIIEGDIFRNINSDLKLVEKRVSIEPLKPLLKKVREKIADFAEVEDLNNGFTAADWCYQHGLLQQAYTIGQETIISLLAKHFFGNYRDKDIRNLASACVSKAADIKEEKMPWTDIRNDAGKVEAEKVEESVHHPLLQELSSPYNDLSGYRNSLNHASLTANHTAQHFIDKFALLTECRSILDKYLKTPNAPQPLQPPLP